MPLKMHDSRHAGTRQLRLLGSLLADALCLCRHDHAGGHREEVMMVDFPLAREREGAIDPKTAIVKAAAIRFRRS
jgi:hypothetical protein